MRKLRLWFRSVDLHARIFTSSGPSRVSQLWRHWPSEPGNSCGPENCPGRCRMLSSNPGPSLPSRCQSHPLSCGNQKCLQTLPNVPWKAKSPPAGKHWPTDRLSIHKIVLWSTIFTQLPTWIYHRDQLHSWQRAPSDTVDERSFSCVLKATGVAIECFLLWAVFLHRCWLVQVSHSWQFLLPKLYPIGGWSQSGSLEMELMWGFIVFYLFLKVFINLIYLFGCVMS